MELQGIFGGGGGSLEGGLEVGLVATGEENGDTEEEVLQGYLSLAVDLRNAKDMKGAVGCYAEAMDLLAVRIVALEAEENDGEEREAQPDDTPHEQSKEQRRDEIITLLNQIYRFCDEVSAPVVSPTFIPYQLQPQVIEEMRKLTSSIFQARKRLLGEHHLETESSKLLLMLLSYGVGRWSEVIVIGRELIANSAAETRVLSASQDLRIRYTLAQVLRELDKAEKKKAKILLEGIHATQSELLGLSDDETFRTANDLAAVYESLDDSAAALALLESNANSASDALGETAPKTLSCLSAHAALLARMGRKGDANKILEKVEDSLDEVKNRRDKYFVDAMANRARTLITLEEVEEAEAAFEELLPIQLTALGARHPSTLVTHEDHAKLLQSLGDFEGALAVFKEVAALRSAHFGRYHPLTLRALFEIASCLGASGRFADAKTLLEDIGEGYAVCLGRTSGKYIEALQGFGTILVQMGHLVSARKVHEQVLAILTEKYGVRDEQTINALVKLAGVVWSSGMETEGLAMEVKAMELQRSVLGPRHPATLQTMHNHAVTLQSIGRYGTSLKFIKEVYESRKEVLGETNSHTIASLYTVAVSLEGLGEIKDAVKTGEEVVELAERSLAAGEMEEADVEEYRDSLVGMKKEVELFEKKFGALGGS